MNGGGQGAPFDMAALQMMMEDPTIRQMSEAMAADPAFQQMATAMQAGVRSGQGPAPPRASAGADIAKIVNDSISSGGVGAGAMDGGVPANPIPDMNAMMGRMMNSEGFVQICNQVGSSIVENPEMANMLGKSMEAMREQHAKVMQDDPDLGRRMLRDIEQLAKGAEAATGAAMGRVVGGPAAGATSSLFKDTLKDEDDGEDKQATSDVPTKDSKNEGGAEDRGRSPLHFACGLGDVESVEQLLATGDVPIDIVDSNSNTPLHYAAGYGRKAIVDVLLAAGADHKLANMQGQRPIDVARLNKKDAIILTLEAAEESASDLYV